MREPESAEDLYVLHTARYVANAPVAALPASEATANPAADGGEAS